MSAARDSHTATVVDSDVFLAGGFTGEGTPPLASVDVFRSASGAIEPFGELNQERGGHAAAVAGGSRVLIVGGWIRSHTYTASAELIDPLAGVLSAAHAPYASDALDAVALADGRVLMTGGQVRPAVATDQAAVYDPTTDSWHSVGPMLMPRLKHTSVLLEDGRVLIIGGSPDDNQLLSSTEIFDPQSETFSAGPDLNEPRYKLPGGAIVLSGNRVLIGGGGRTIELLDLGAGTSRVLEAYPDRGSFTTVSTLEGGQYLVLGGYDDRIRLSGRLLILNADRLTG